MSRGGPGGQEELVVGEPPARLSSICFASGSIEVTVVEVSSSMSWSA